MTRRNRRTARSVAVHEAMRSCARQRIPVTCKRPRVGFPGARSICWTLAAAFTRFIGSTPPWAWLKQNPRQVRILIDVFYQQVFANSEATVWQKRRTRADLRRWMRFGASDSCELRTIIEEFIEPDAWGDYAQIRYYQGNYIIRAPDWLHRQIGGYPYAPQNPTSSGASSDSDTSQRRYVIFSSRGTKIEGHELDYTTPSKKTEAPTP